MKEKNNETMGLTAFARKHGVSRKTVSRWRAAGYVVPARGKVDVVASEKLLAERPAEHQGGRARGPTAESAEIAEHIRDYEGLRAAHARAVSIYDSILAELRTLPAGSAEIEVHRIHYMHQDALGAAVKAANGDGSTPSPGRRA